MVFGGLFHLLRVIDEDRSAGVHHDRHERASPRILQDLRRLVQLVPGEHRVVLGEQFDQLLVSDEDGAGILPGEDQVDV